MVGLIMVHGHLEGSGREVIIMDFTKEKKLLNAISKVYNEATIDDYPDLKRKSSFFILKEISEGKSVGEVSMKLSSFLGRYILKHKFGLPKSLIELQEIVSKESQVYRGWASIGIWS
jgi:hypothetical protein